MASKTLSINTICKHANISLYAEHDFFIQRASIYTDAFNTNIEVCKQT